MFAQDCSAPPEMPVTCSDGAEFRSLAAGEVEAVVRAAAASLDAEGMTIAVVDRAGRVLAVYRKRGADAADDDFAVGTARTAAFFSHDMAPLSTRTVRFLSGIHFPPGITNAQPAPLYGIENTNRGCDFNVTFHDGKCVPRAKALDGGPGTGIVTGKRFPDDAEPSSVNAGGIPLYRGGKLVGGIGVWAPELAPDVVEFAAVTGAFGAAGIVPVPSFPLPEPGNVFIDGIRLPFLGTNQRLTFDGDAPTGLQRPRGTRAGSDDGTFTIGPRAGGCVANEYLVGPRAGSRFSEADVDAIVQRAIRTAKRTRAAIRLPLGSYARLVIAVADVDGTVLALYRMPDATVFSIDVAVAKARNVAYFSANGLAGVPPGTAVTNRTIGFLSQPLYPPGIDSRIYDVRPGPAYTSLFLHDLASPCTQGAQPPNANQNGIVFFAGSTPLRRNNQLAGGLGISGDGVEQDDYVAYHAAGDFLPHPRTWADRLRVEGARLPMFKFPRQPERVTECGGPCS